MGSVKKTAAKGHKQRSQFRPKKSDGADKSKFKKKAKKEKDSIRNRTRIERKAGKNDENMQIENIGMKVKKKKKMMKEVETLTGNGAVIEKPSASQQLMYFLHLYQSGNGIQLSALELEAFKGLPFLFFFLLPLFIYLFIFKVNFVYFPMGLVLVCYIFVLLYFTFCLNLWATCMSLVLNTVLDYINYFVDVIQPMDLCFMFAFWCFFFSPFFGVFS